MGAGAVAAGAAGLVGLIAAGQACGLVEACHFSSALTGSCAGCAAGVRVLLVAVEVMQRIIIFTERKP